MWQIWLIIAGIFFIGEIITVGFLIFWVGVAALITALLSVFVQNVIVQTVVFVITSTLLIFLTKPLAKKLTKADGMQTNAYSIVGKIGMVTKKITAHSVGQVKVGSEIWSATSTNNLEIEEGMEVTITEIKGVKAIVEPLKVENTK